MKKTNQHTAQPKKQNNTGNGPTLRELELMLKRIEELDSRLESLSVESIDSKEAA